MGQYIKTIFIILLLYCKAIHAQQTIVTGKIVDGATNEPLPFVNVIFKNTTDGASSDIEGNYNITTQKPVDSIIVSFVGYNKVTRAVKPNQTQTINVVLTQGMELATVEVAPGENPANRVLKKVIANKEKNDKRNLAAYEYEVYNKLEFDLNNFGEKFKKRKILKPFSFVFDNIDSSNADEKPFLPLFMTESISDFFYRKSPKTINEHIKATKVAGVQNNSVSQFMGDMYQNINIYDNTILVFGKNFIGPIHNDGLLYYKYLLIDSVYIDSVKCFQLRFKPRFKQDLTFSGNIWIAEKSYAVKQLEMSISPGANINFINTNNIIQKFKYVDGAWMIDKERLVIDFNLTANKSNRKQMVGIYGRRTASYKNFVINKPRDNSFYAATGNIKIAANANEKSSDYWQTNRHDTLSKNEKKIYYMVDTLKTLPAYKSWVEVIQLLAGGYWIKGYVEIGPVYKTYSYNIVEGHRFRLGGKTSNKYNQWYELSGYAAYGLRDQKFKYSFGIRGFIDKKPRTMVGAYYKDDNEMLGQSQKAFSPDNMLAALFRIRPLTKLNNVKEISSYIEREWFYGFSTRLSFFNRTISPLGDFNYEYQISPTETAQKKNIITSELRLFTRFAYNEKFVEGAFNRVSLGTKYPILQTNYVLGLKNVLHGEYDFQQLTLNLSDRLRINPIGYFDYMLEWGKVWGKLPFPLLELHPGNETYISDNTAFNTMNYYEFVSDHYGSAGISHHFDGFFLNKIPLLNKLKWREVVGFKTVMGYMNDANKKEMNFPAYLYTFNKVPFMEINAGIENIFKVVRIDGFWRLNYLHHPNVSPFTVKATLQFLF